MPTTLEIKTVDFNKNIGYFKPNFFLDSSVYGVKASSLSLNSNLFKWIPEGFVLSKNMVSLISLGLLSDEEIHYLKFQFEDLKTKSGSIILRSSSSLEWVDGNSYAGLFHSSRNILTFDNLINEVKQCYRESLNEKIRHYAELKSVALPEEHMALIVQKQISCDSSALLIVNKHNDYLEFYNEDIINSISGITSPHFVIQNITQNKRQKDKISDEIASEFLKIIDVVRSSLKNNESVHLELGISDNKVYVFQINVLKNENTNNVLSANKKNIPSKAESMEWFYNNGLFKNPLKVYDFNNINNLYENICNDFDFSEAITVRFSLGNEINLPRGFFDNSNDLNNWLLSLNIDKNYKVIVHTYIKVRRSFELLLDNDKFLLEHIPGMWESDNKLNPDVMFSDENTLKTWVWNKKREGLKINGEKSDLDKYEVVLSENILVEWQLKLNKILPILRLKFKKDLPLNFHFVEDENSEWSFLNIRDGFELQSPEIKQSNTHIISNKNDISGWDGKKPLQLQLSTERGHDLDLIEIIKQLPLVKNKNIIVDFGLLSHPAMILREFGYNLIPNYLYNADRIFSPNYISTRFDVKNDPVKRIMLEESLFENSIFKVVNDRSPMVKGHLLVMSKQPYTSMIEVNDLINEYKKLLDSLEEKKLIQDSYIMIERGRARFCTSGFTDSHAHAHIIPTNESNKDVVRLFIERVSAVKYSSFEEAIIVAKKSDNEYIILVDEKKEVYLRVMPDNVSVEKQLIRQHFSYGTK